MKDLRQIYTLRVPSYPSIDAFGTKRAPPAASSLNCYLDCVFGK
jgi:hypothetical protein